jgi:hypothetical protein
VGGFALSLPIAEEGRVNRDNESCAHRGEEAFGRIERYIDEEAALDAADL